MFEKVTGRVSLETGKILESALKEACRRAGSQYHEAADEILISGSWQQVLETRRIISSRIQDGGGTRRGARRESSSSSDYSESISSKSGVISFDTKPQIAKYIKTFHHDALKNIEQGYPVKISWSKDYTKVHIKDLSSSHCNDKLLSYASEKFVELYHHFNKIVISIPFDVSSDDLKEAVYSIPQHVSDVILDQSEDRRTCRVWGTVSSLENVRDWIREKLSIIVERPKSYSPKGPPKNALVHETVNKLKVVVYQGDITKENADIVVNACNKHLDHAGGVSYAISKAGGPSIQRDSDAYVKKHGSIQTGCVAITKPGYLHCKHIVHAVGPQWKKHGKERCMELFQTLFMNVYKAACQVDARSIAMPAISSGIYGVPKNVCAQAVFLFVDEINQKLASDSSARPFEIRLVNIDGEIVEAFSTELNKWKLKGRKMQRRHSFDVVREEEVEKPVERKSVDDMAKTPRMKFTLGPLFNFRRQKPSSKDGNAQASKIKYSGGCTSAANSSATSTVSHASSTAGTKVKKGASMTSLQDSNDPPSSNDPSSSAAQSLASSGLGTSNARFNSSSTDPATTGSSSYGAVLSTSRSSTLSLRKKSDSTIRYEQNGIDSHSPDSGKDFQALVFSLILYSLMLKGFHHQRYLVTFKGVFLLIMFVP